jgi:hypothetical protein
MSNKRVSEFSAITAGDLKGGDLFLVSDLTNVESKKMTATELVSYMQARITASFTSAVSASFASSSVSASHAVFSDTAGTVTGTVTTASFAITASYAINFNGTSSWASKAISSSYAATSSLQLISTASYATNAKSASYLIYSGTPNGFAHSASLATNATYARTSSFLIGLDLSGGFDGPAKGTASYALSAKNANTASYILYSGAYNGKISSASNATIAVLATTANFLNYSVGTSNGTASNARTASFALTASYIATASYATNAGLTPGVYRLYGPFTPTLSTPASGAVSISITSSTAYPVMLFEVNGDCGIPLRTTPATDGKIVVNAYRLNPGPTSVDVVQTWAHASVGATGLTAGSAVTSSFYVRQYTNAIQAGYKWDISFVASECNFQNGYNPLTLWIQSGDVDNINVA